MSPLLLAVCSRGVYSVAGILQLFIRLLMAVGLFPALGNYEQIASAVFTCGLYVNIKFRFSRVTPKRGMPAFCEM